MENQSNTSTKAKHKPLIIHLSQGLINSSIHNTIKEHHIPLELSSYPEMSDLILTKKDQLIEAVFLKKYQITLTETQLNLNNLLLNCFKKVQKKELSKVIALKPEHKINKYIEGKVKKLHDWSKKRDDILDLSFNTATLQILPKRLLELHPFSSYMSSHLFLHPKGQSSAVVFDYNTTYGFKKRQIPVREFNEIFSSIKKSKNKSFNTLQLKSLNIELLGSFLAKELELSDHNIIVIISRNDFLSPDKEEISYFNSFTRLLPKFLNQLIQAEKVNTETLSLLESLKNLEYPVRILEDNEKVFFQNTAYEKNLGTMELQQKIHLNNSLLLEIYDLKDFENSTTDIFHFQRISLLGELLNTLRHELSNPLFGLKLAVDIFDTDNIEEDNVEILKEISSGISRSQMIIENFSNLYKNKSEFIVESIKKLINETFTLTKSETKGIHKYIEYINIDDEDPINLKVNPTWFVQIVFNLIINSAQAMKTKGTNKDSFIKIVIEKEAQQIYIHVSDNGPGLKNITSKDLFVPFETTKKSGTGLGLSISKNLAKKMKGDLTFIEDYQEGAQFCLTLPTNYEDIDY